MLQQLYSTNYTVFIFDQIIMCYKNTHRDIKLKMHIINIVNNLLLNLFVSLFCT